MKPAGGSTSIVSFDLNLFGGENESLPSVFPDQVHDEPLLLEFQPLESGVSPSVRTKPSSKSPDVILGKRKRRDSLAELKESAKKLAKLHRDPFPASPRPPVSDAEVQQAKDDINTWIGNLNYNQCPHLMLLPEHYVFCTRVALLVKLHMKLLEKT